MLLINCEVNLILTSSKDCVITNSTGKGKFPITETKKMKMIEHHIPFIIFQK